jgi:UDP-glucose 4-epimerase
VIARFCAGADTIFGDGRQTRDFVFVGDVVEAFIAAADSPRQGLCNISTGVETTILELAELLGISPRFAPARPGEVRRSCLDPSRARHVLGWTARTPLHEGLTLTSTALATRPARPA